MKITLVGVSHHGAAVELRERVALRHEEAKAVASQLASAAGEAVCLSTCNRTELYVAHDDDVPAEVPATSVLLEREPDLANALYRLSDEAAALHLFRVAAGLDSLVPGEGEILGQVRAAFEEQSRGMAQIVADGLTQDIFLGNLSGLHHRIEALLAHSSVTSIQIFDGSGNLQRSADKTGNKASAKALKEYAEVRKAISADSGGADMKLPPKASPGAKAIAWRAPSTPPHRSRSSLCIASRSSGLFTSSSSTSGGSGSREAARSVIRRVRPKPVRSTCAPSSCARSATV